MEPIEKIYNCVKCGAWTMNRQIVGSHCPHCWDNFIVTTITKMPIDHNIRKWLHDKKEMLKIK